MLSESKGLFGRFLGGIFGQETPNLIYSTTVLYDAPYFVAMFSELT